MLFRSPTSNDLQSVRRKSHSSALHKTYLSERAQPGKNTSSNPRRVLPLRWRKDLYPHVLDRQLLQLRQQPVAEALGQRAAARQHNVAVERLAQVQVRPVDGVDDNLVHAGVLEADDFRVEEDLGRPEPLGADLGGTRGVSASHLPTTRIDGALTGVIRRSLVTLHKP